jgi:hypothetical protein
MPLPRRVDEVDMDGTRVTPVAYEPTSPPRNGAPDQPSATATTIESTAEPLANQPPSRPSRRLTTGGMNMAAVLCAFVDRGLFSVVILLLMGGTALLFSYYSIARTLPSVEDLQNRASQFETTRILDRNGNLLYEILDPTRAAHVCSPR